MRESEAIEQCAVGRDLRAGLGLERILRNELPLVGPAFVDQRRAVFEQRLKPCADGGLVLHAEFCKVRERGVVGGDPPMIGLEWQRAHERLCV